MSFGARLDSAFDEHGHLCVGIDPHPYLLHSWGLTDDPTGLRAFSLRVIEATVGRAAIIKPQVAFFERHGSAGFAVLEEVLATARAAGLLVIADAKRGDVGTSVEAYGEAWLSPGSPLEADALTVSAYQGFGSLAAVIDVAEHNGKGLFVLAATSNPESLEPQSGRITLGVYSGRMVAAGIVSHVEQWNASRASAVGAGQAASPTGSIGVVLGATVDFDALEIDVNTLSTVASSTPILAPGFGHQGADFSDVRAIYRGGADVAIVAASRSILSQGPVRLESAIDTHSEHIARGLLRPGSV